MCRDYLKSNGMARDIFVETRGAGSKGQISVDGLGKW